MKNDDSDLKRKLSFLKQKTKAEPKAYKAPKETPVEFHLPGWEKQGEFSYVYTHREAIPDLSRLLKHSLIFDQAVVPAELIFFDTETTGLSGGAGNRIFLFAMGFVEKDILTVKQYFMADYPGEMEFLDLILKDCPEESVYVSYNGKTFDSYLFKSRLDLFCRPFPITRQLDLLHWSRRFWKRPIGSCRLSHIEEKVLNISRVNDIPGYQVPAAYFDFLRTGRTDDLALVFHHNLQDVISLALLLHQMLVLTQENDGDGADTKESLLTIHTPADPSSLSRLFFERDPLRAMEILEKAFAKGDQRSGALLAKIQKRQGRYNQACEIWEQLFTKRPSPYYAIELAKLWEHQFKDYFKAMEWVEMAFQAQSYLLPAVRDDLRKRRERLKNKMSV